MAGKRHPKPRSSAAKALQKALMHETMHNYKYGRLHSGSKTGPIVKRRDQAIAIGLSVSARSIKKSKNARSMAQKTVQSTKRRLASPANAGGTRKRAKK
jgi:hypothetical protein